MFYRTQAPLAQSYCERRVRRVVFHKNYVGVFNGYFGSAPNGYADVGFGKGRRVVNSVAHERHFIAAAFKPRNRFALAVGQNSRNVIYSKLIGNGFRGYFVVAGNHYKFFIFGFKFRNRVFRAFANFVGYSEYGYKFAAFYHKHRGFALCGKLLV